MKKYIAALLAAGMLSATPVEACYGVRSMGMGGAFIAVADDASTVYWNPAGLAFVPEKEAAFQYITNNRNSINYINVAAFTTPLDDGKSGFGFHYVTDYDIKQGSAYYKADWYVLSYGEKMSDKLALGANVRWSVERTNAFRGDWDATMFDVSLLYKASNKLSFGLLVQDVNRAEISRGTMVRNYRPGIAYRPDDKTIIAADVYDAINEIERDYTVGIERALSDEVRVRAGNYQGSMTYGLGYRVNKALELNYAHLAGKLGRTNMIGIQAKF